MKLAPPKPSTLSNIVPLIYPRRRKRSLAVIEQRNDPQEAMSQTLDSYMVPTKPPKRRRLTKEERHCVAYVRKMKACPSCWEAPKRTKLCFLYCRFGRIMWRMPIPTHTHLLLKALDRKHQLQTPWRRLNDLDSAPRSPPSGYGSPHTLISGYGSPHTEIIPLYISSIQLER